MPTGSNDTCRTADESPSRQFALQGNRTRNLLIVSYDQKPLLLISDGWWEISGAERGYGAAQTDGDVCPEMGSTSRVGGATHPLRSRPAQRDFFSVLRSKTELFFMIKCSCHVHHRPHSSNATPTRFLSRPLPPVCTSVSAYTRVTFSKALFIINIREHYKRITTFAQH